MSTIKTNNAFILSVSTGFSVGAFALIDSMIKYGHNEDLHILIWDDFFYKKYKDTFEKLQKLADEAPFRVTLQPIYKLRENFGFEKDRGWDCRFYAYPYMIEQDYEIYFIWQGDQLMLNNVSKYFEIAKKFILLSNNFNHARSKVSIENKETISKPMSNPICNMPFITSDKELLEAIWKEGVEYGRGDMIRIYNAIVKTDKLEDLFLLHYTHWVYDWHYNEPISKVGDGYFKPGGGRINSYHGPLWTNWGFNRKRFNENLIKKHKMIYNEYQKIIEKYEL